VNYKLVSTEHLNANLLSYVYQNILLADIAAMRGLTPKLYTLAPPKSRNELIVAFPGLQAGLQDPEQRLSLNEVLEAIVEGVKQFQIDYSENNSIPPEEIAQILLYLLSKGYLIAYPSRKTGSPRDKYGYTNEQVKDIIKIIERTVGSNFNPFEFEYKSFHGELARLSANASPLPSKYEAAGFLTLPAVLEPLPSTAEREGLPLEAKRWITSQCNHHQDKGAKLIQILEDALSHSGYNVLNRYQYEVISEYFKKRSMNNTHIDAILTAPTGAGKTLAFIIIALVEILVAKCQNTKSPVILVYPRKTLARDQVEDLAKILSYINDKLDSKIFLWLRDGSSGVPQCPSGKSDCVQIHEEWEPIRGIVIPGTPNSPPETAKHRYKDDAYHSSPNWLLDVKDSVNVEINGSLSKPEELADIVVTNYDMLFKESLDLLRATPSPLGRLLKDAKLVVLDEAHMVIGGRQSIMVQTYMLALRLNNKRPGIILSSATLTERKILEEHNRLSLANVVAIRIKKGVKKDRALNVFENLLGVKPLDKTVYADYYKIASQNPNGWKLTFWTIIYPSLLKKPVTALNEALVSLTHALAAARARWGGEINVKAISFVEYKSTLRDIASEFTRRIILESGDVYDRVLLPDLFDSHFALLRKWLQNSQQNMEDTIDTTYFPVTTSNGVRRAQIEITHRIREIVSSNPHGSIKDIIWKDEFSRFHALAPYIKARDYSCLLHCNPSSSKDPPKTVEKIIQCIINNPIDVFPPAPLAGDVWMEHMLVHAALMLKHSSWTNGEALHRYYEEIKDIQSRTGVNLSQFIPILVHHGDYTGPHRHLADRLIKEANPLIIISTSTLEVGLNIPGIITTVHYILPREPGRILQMVGRSGRNPSTMRVSHGIVILRQNAWETLKRAEMHAFRYFNEVTTPPNVILPKNPYSLAQLCITLQSSDCNAFQSIIQDNNTLWTASRIVSNRSDIIANIPANPYNIPSQNSSRPECSRLLTGLLAYKLNILGRFQELYQALDALSKVCSGERNHAVMLAVAENAYRTILDTLAKHANIPANIANLLNLLLNEIHKLRLDIYSHITNNISSTVKLSTGNYDITEIVESLVYPRGFEVPGGEDKKTIAGRVILIG